MGQPCFCGSQALVPLPTGSVTEHNKAFLVGAFYEGHAGVLLPVSHGLLKDGPLAAWNDRQGRCLSFLPGGQTTPKGFKA